jgi:hypothetical protein
LIRETRRLAAHVESTSKHSAKYGEVLDHQLPKRSALRFNLIIALVVWALWLVFGGKFAIHHLFADWKVALTMVFGSLVGGGTSEGGARSYSPSSRNCPT